MANHFKIKLTQESTSPGLYTIYYDSINNFNIAINYLNNTPAINLTLNQLLGGVIVQVPDPTTKVILYNQNCKTQKEFTVEPKLMTYPCICVIILDKTSGQSEKIEGCYANESRNGKPLYTGPQASFVWNSTGQYWDMSGYTKPNASFRSNDTDEIPNSLWVSVGPNGGNYVLNAAVGTCSSVGSGAAILIAEGQNATCENDDGSITANAIGGTPPWKYSLEGGIGLYQDIGIFNQLPAGTYQVYAKDSNNVEVVDTVVITHPPINFFSIPAATIQITPTNKVGNVQYYSINITYDTSQIPTGEAVVFDYEIIYTLRYNEPGSVTFETNQNSINKNGNTISLISTETQQLTKGNPIQCNFNYHTYEGLRKYSASSISLVKNDIFSFTGIYGIDTTTSGNVDGSCRTTAFLFFAGSFVNVEPSCNCCQLNQNTVNANQPPQIFV